MAAAPVVTMRTGRALRPASHACAAPASVSTMPTASSPVARASPPRKPARTSGESATSHQIPAIEPTAVAHTQASAPWCIAHFENAASRVRRTAPTKQMAKPLTATAPLTMCR